MAAMSCPTRSGVTSVNLTTRIPRGATLRKQRGITVVGQVVRAHVVQGARADRPRFDETDIDAEAAELDGQCFREGFERPLRGRVGGSAGLHGPPSDAGHESRRPLRRCRICRRTAWVTRIAPAVFSVKRRSISAIGLASTAAAKMVPAFEMETSISPVSAMAPSTLAWSVTSRRSRWSTSRPSKLCGYRAVATTRWPRRPRRRWLGRSPWTRR